jgi:lysophospholipase L1-like esterase
LTDGIKCDNLITLISKGGYILMKSKVLSILTAITLASTLMISSVFAEKETTEIPDVLILGDSISTGYGLAEGTPSYGEIVAEQLGANYTNLAVNGSTTSDLLKSLNEDETVIDAVTEAEVICISTGGNDMLGVFLTEISQYKEEGDTLLDAVDKLLANQVAVYSLILKLNQSITPAVNNITTICQTIDTLNSDAVVVFQTIYNPFEISSGDTNELAALYEFANGYINTINTGIKNIPDITVIDTYENFKGYGWLYTNITLQDIHPNKFGHMEIASRITSVLKDVSFESIFASMLTTLSPDELSLIPSEILAGLIPDETSDITEETDETSNVTEDTTYETDETSDVTEDTTDETDETSNVTEDTTDETDETSDVTEDTTDETDETSVSSDEITSEEDTTPEDFVPVYGDIDLDGEIRIADIIVLNKYLVGLINLNASQRENADCSYDGNIDMADNMMIAAYLCDKIDVLGPDYNPIETDITEITLEETETKSEDETTITDETTIDETVITFEDEASVETTEETTE